MFALGDTGHAPVRPSWERPAQKNKGWLYSRQRPWHRPWSGSELPELVRGECPDVSFVMLAKRTMSRSCLSETSFADIAAEQLLRGNRASCYRCERLMTV